jgi:phasin family protein
MADTKRMAEEGKKLGEEAAEQTRRVGQATQEQVKRAGEDFQEAARTGLEAANLSFGKVNRGFQAIAAEMTEYSKKALEDVAQAWEQLLRARSFGDVVDIQTRYAQRAFNTHTAEMSRLAELYRDIASNAAKPIEQNAKRFGVSSDR